MEWEIAVAATEASNKMVFESTDGSFSSEGTMNTRGHKLPINTTGSHKVANSLGAFVVEPMNLGLETTSGEIIVKFGGGPG